jgi:hypothetical protein
MESEHSQNFHTRLNQWVASQGFWFHLRYSMLGRSSKGIAAYYVLNLGLRILIFLLVVAAVGWLYLLKRESGEGFQKELVASVTANLHATETKIDGFEREQGKLTISRLGSLGGRGSFFDSIDARIVKCRVGILESLTKNWDPGELQISSLDVDLRVGADDEKWAGQMSESFFGSLKKANLSTFVVERANVHWGYSERTRGSIQGSFFQGKRYRDGWRLEFSGGRFSQNWLKDLEIVNLVVHCMPGEILFEKAEFRAGRGTADLSGLKLVTGVKPTVSGTAKLKSVSLENLLPLSIQGYIEGVISSDFTVSGGINSSQGIVFEGNVEIGGDDVISVRDRVHLLRALTIVDFINKYRRLDFKTGSFSLKTGGSGLTIADANLKAGDLFTLQGKMTVRLPTKAEQREGIESLKMDDASLFEGEGLTTGASPTSLGLAPSFEKPKSGRDSKASNDEEGLFEKIESKHALRQQEVSESEGGARLLRYEGLFKVSLLPHSFDRAEALKEHAPVDPQTGRIPIDVPLSGTLNDLTRDQAEEIYKLGQR